MFIVLGATGHVGSAVAETLLANKEDVLVITHDAKKKKQWVDKGAQVAVVDILDTDALHKVFLKGKRLFLLNPPAAPSTDTVQTEQQTLASILKAIEGTDLEKVVGESTYGAQPGEGVGDLNVLYNMEQGLAQIRMPNKIVRGAYYMSNWDQSLKTAKKDGVISTLYPIEFKIPMVAPRDIGVYAAGLLKEPLETTRLHYVEGPVMYSSKDVADAFAVALDREVKAVPIHREQWIPALRKMGYSEVAAKSMAMMSKITLDQSYFRSDKPHRGETTLQEYISGLVAQNTKANV